MAQGPLQGLLASQFFQGTGGFEGLLGSPAFNVGMGLLAAGHDGRINPFEAAMTGMVGAKQFRMLEQDRKREKEEQERLDKAREAASKIIGGMFPAQTVEMGPPAPDGSMTQGVAHDPMGQLLQQVAATEGPGAALDLASRFQGSMAETPAAIQEMEYLLELAKQPGPAGDAARIKLRLMPGAQAPDQGFAQRFGTFQGADGRERFWRGDPNSGGIEIMGDSGQWQPLGVGAMAPQAPVTQAPQSVAQGGQSSPSPFVGRPQEEQAAAVKRAESEVEKDQSAPRDVQRADATIGRINSTMDEVDKAITQISPLSAGVGSLLGGLPATSARDLQSRITTIKANIGFNELQAMREASPTGGALGQVAVQELEALQSVIASLDTRQSPEQLKENLQKVKRHYTNWAQTVAQARAQAAGRMDAPPPPPAPAQNNDDPLGIRK